MAKKKSLLTQIPGFKKSRKYPIKYDEYGRSARQQAFDYFDQGYRPAQISKQELVPISLKTLLRYFEDWKKQTQRVSRSILRKLIKEKPEFTEEYVKMLADYFEVPEEEVILRLRKPWGIESLSKGELPDTRLYRIQSEVEARLEAALRLIYLGEHIYRNSPKKISRFLAELLNLRDNTILTIAKVKGEIVIRKEDLNDEKIITVSGGYAIKRKARVEHRCYDCDHLIQPGEEYYQLSLEHYRYGYYTKSICEQCWKGSEPGA